MFSFLSSEKLSQNSFSNLFYSSANWFTEQFGNWTRNAYQSVRQTLSSDTVAVNPLEFLPPDIQLQSYSEKAFQDAIEAIEQQFEEKIWQPKVWEDTLRFYFEAVKAGKLSLLNYHQGFEKLLAFSSEIFEGKDNLFKPYYEQVKKEINEKLIDKEWVSKQFRFSIYQGLSKVLDKTLTVEEWLEELESYQDLMDAESYKAIYNLSETLTHQIHENDLLNQITQEKLIYFVNGIEMSCHSRESGNLPKETQVVAWMSEAKSRDLDNSKLPSIQKALNWIWNHKAEAFTLGLAASALYKSSRLSEENNCTPINFVSNFAVVYGTQQIFIQNSPSILPVVMTASLFFQEIKAQGFGVVGNEFLVNTYSSSDQTNPVTAALSDGGFLVAWNSNGQDGSGQGVFGKRYSASGIELALPTSGTNNAVGNEFPINSYTLNDQTNPAISTLLDGGFVVVWVSNGQDSSGWGVYGKRYASNGTVLIVPTSNTGGAIGNEFPVNSYTSNDQGSTDPFSIGVAALQNTGGFVAVWMSNGQDGSGYGIYGKQYSANGTEITLVNSGTRNATGSEFPINTYVQNDQTFPTIASLTDGGFVVAWSSLGQYDSVSREIYGKRFAVNGTEIILPTSGAAGSLGNEFRVNNYTTNDQSYSSIFSFPDGGFLAIWDSLNQDSSSWGVYGKRFFANGTEVALPTSGNNTAVGNEFRINTYITNDQSRQSMGVFNDNSFVIAWHSSNQNNGYDVYGKRFFANGTEVALPTSGNNTALGNEFPVNNYILGDQNTAKLSILNDGGFIIVWQSQNQDGSGYGCYGRRYAANGTEISLQLSFTPPPNTTFYDVIGTSSDDYALDVQEDMDGSLIVGGITGNSAFISKLLNNGTLLWAKQFTDSYSATGTALVIDASGNYIMTGTASNSTSSHNVLLAKWSNNGNLISAIKFGDNGDTGEKISLKSNGELLMTGVTANSGAGDWDIFLTNWYSNNTLKWAKTIGGAGAEAPYGGVQVNLDGEIIVVAISSSFGVGGDDILIFKCAQNGSLIWSTTIGGTNEDGPTHFKILSDQSIVISGATNSFGTGNYDALLAKLWNNGTLAWAKILGEINNSGRAVQETPQGDLLLVIDTNDFGVNGTATIATKLSSNGSLIDAQMFAGNGIQSTNMMRQSVNGEWIIAGSVNSSSGAGNYDVMLVRLTSQGDLFNCNMSRSVNPNITDITNRINVTYPNPTVLNWVPTITNLSLDSVLIPSVQQQCFSIVNPTPMPTPIPTPNPTPSFPTPVQESSPALTSQPLATRPSSSSSGNHTVPIAVGVTLGVAVALGIGIGGAVWFFKKRKKEKEKSARESTEMIQPMQNNSASNSKEYANLPKQPSEKHHYDNIPQSLEKTPKHQYDNIPAAGMSLSQSQNNNLSPNTEQAIYNSIPKVHQENNSDKGDTIYNSFSLKQ